MSMVTQCPQCRTAFNVTPEQLFVRDGRVRCGHCKSVFDGLVNLTSLEALKAGTPPPLAEATQAEMNQPLLVPLNQRKDGGCAFTDGPLRVELCERPVPLSEVEEKVVPLASHRRKLSGAKQRRSYAARDHH